MTCPYWGAPPNNRDPSALTTSSSQSIANGGSEPYLVGAVARSTVVLVSVNQSHSQEPSAAESVGQMTTGNPSSRMQQVSSQYHSPNIHPRSRNPSLPDDGVSETCAVNNSTPAAANTVSPSGSSGLITTESGDSMQELVQQIALYFNIHDRASNITDIVQEAYRANDTNYNIQDAVKWADGFTIPKDAIANDYGLLRAAGLSFDKMVEIRFRQLLFSRLNRDRIEATISADNPDKARLLDLANGMQVPVPTGFIPNGQSQRPPMRKAYRTAHSAVNKLNHETWKEGLAFYLPLSVAQHLIIGCHLSPAHWTSKKDKVSGRPLIDPTDDSIPNSVLNGPEIRDRATALWAPIEHPTITDIVTMIIEFYERARTSDPSITWDDIVIWKMDLKGAYTLLSFRPDCAKLFGVEITDDESSVEGMYAMFFLCGVFGWTGTPYAFQVVTRSLVHELHKTTCGDVRMYVDDLIGVCLRRDYDREKEAAYKLCTALLGPTAIAEHKTECGRRLEVIGYTIDLDLRLVTISKKNFLKTLHGYYTVDLSKPVPRRTIEKLASWGSRYAFICRFMKPFNRALYAALPTQRQRSDGHNYNPHASQALPISAQRAIRLWRAMLCALQLDESRFSRSFELFKDAPATMVCEFDSSLTGSGMLFYQCNPDGSETVLGGAAISLSSLGFEDDSSFQNTSEFIAIVLCLRVLRAVFPEVKTISLRGDSVSALTWASKGQFRGDIITNSSILHTLILIVTGIEIVGDPILHIRGEDNWRCDGLSRGKSMLDIGMNHVKFFDLNSDPLSMELLSLCDPATPIEIESDFANFFRRCNGAISHLSSRLFRGYKYYS